MVYCGRICLIEGSSVRAEIAMEYTVDDFKFEEDTTLPPDFTPSLLYQLHALVNRIGDQELPKCAMGIPAKRFITPGAMAICLMAAIDSRDMVIVGPFNKLTGEHGITREGVYPLHLAQREEKSSAFILIDKRLTPDDLQQIVTDFSS